MKYFSILTFLLIFHVSSFAQSEAASDAISNARLFNICLSDSVNLKSLSFDANPEPEKLQDFQNGFFVDGLLGFNGARAIGHQFANSLFSINIGGRIGSKWYMGGVKKWQYGVQATWARIGLTFGLPTQTSGNTISSATSLHFAPTAGFINAIKFNDKFGLEANLNLGFNLLVTFISTTGTNYRMDATIVQPGFMVNPCAKFRMKSFAVGLDIAIMYAGPANYTMVDNFGTYNRVASLNILTILSVTVGKVF